MFEQIYNKLTRRSGISTGVRVISPHPETKFCTQYNMYIIILIQYVYTQCLFKIVYLPLEKS